MHRERHTLARLLALAALTLTGCYASHDGPTDDAGPLDGGGPACGCQFGQICIVSCIGQRACVANPGARLGCDPFVESCFVSDPCRAEPSFGFSGGLPLNADWTQTCVCPAQPPPPPPPPGETSCGANRCTDDEVCVEDCEGFGPGCVPRGPASCDDACDCFDEDPCSGGRCALVRSDGRVICECGPPPSTTCEEHLETGLGTTCDDSTYGTCSTALDGVPCCFVESRCENGVIVDDGFCTDDCAQGCGVLEGPGACRLGGCHWYEPEGCYEGTEGVLETEACLERRQPCTPGDGTCEAVGRECVGLASHPCPGGRCDACLTVEFFCERRL